MFMPRRLALIKRSTGSGSNVSLANERPMMKTFVEAGDGQLLNRVLIMKGPHDVAPVIILDWNRICLKSGAALSESRGLV